MLLVGIDGLSYLEIIMSEFFTASQIQKQTERKQLEELLRSLAEILYKQIDEIVGHHEFQTKNRRIKVTGPPEVGGRWKKESFWHRLPVEETPICSMASNQHLAWIISLGNGLVKLRSFDEWGLMKVSDSFVSVNINDPNCTKNLRSMLLKELVK